MPEVGGDESGGVNLTTFRHCHKIKLGIELLVRATDGRPGLILNLDITYTYIGVTST